MRLRGIDLVPVLTKLGRDEVHLERGVDLLCGLRGDLLTALLRTDAVEAVLVEEQLSAKSQAAQADVVLLGSGEVEECRSERPRRNDAEIDLKAAVDDDRAFRFATSENALDAGRAREDLEDRRSVVARDDDVDVADRLLVAAEAAGDRKLCRAGLGAEGLGHLHRGRAGLVQERATRSLFQCRDRAEDVLPGLSLDLRN